MPVVVATVVRHGRAFSGTAAARIVGDVGGRTWRPAAALRLSCCHDRARACAWPLRSWWVPPVTDRAVRLQLMRAEHAIRGAWLRGSISTGGGRGEFLPQHLAPVIFVSFASDPEQCARPFAFA
jgi:hypothetical protein